MADITIGGLNQAQVIGEDDLFLLEQNGEAMNLKGSQLTEFVNRHIDNIVVTFVAASQAGSASYNNATRTLTLNIPKGNGITSVTYASTSGLTKTYNINFDVGDPGTFTVNNGVGISSIGNKQTVGNEDTYTIYLTDGSEYTFTVINGTGGVNSVANVGPATGSNGNVPADSLSAALLPYMRTKVSDTFTGITWVTEVSPTYSEFPNHADISISGVTANDFVDVVLSVDDAMSGDFAPVVESRANAIRLWAVNTIHTSMDLTVMIWR